jgi:hypothetical protein
MLAAALLTVMSFHNLFAGTAVGFLASAALVVSVSLPKMRALTVKRSIYDKTTRGMRIFLKTPRLRGLLALNMAVAAASAMVIVNTVVLVQADFGFSQRSTAIALAFFGVGSMVSALVLPAPRQNERPHADACGDRAFSDWTWAGYFPEGLLTLVVLWALLGVGYSLSQTPVVACCAAHQRRKTDRRCLPLSLHCRIHAGW